MKRMENCINKININYLLYTMIVISPMLVLQICRKELFLLLQIVFVIVMFIQLKKMYITKSFFLLFIFLEPFVTAIFAQFSNMSVMYKKTALNLFIMSIPLYFTIFYLNDLVKKNKNIVDIVKKALKLTIILEIIWIALQFIFYRVFNIDINQLVFVNILHMVDNASFIRDWVWYPSGFCWHSAVLAPLFVIGIFIIDNKFIKFLILCVSLICGNRTTLLGVILSYVLLFINSVKNKKIKFQRKYLNIIPIVFIICVILFLFTGIGDKILDALNKLVLILFSESKDASTAAHLGYYQDYFKILKMSSVSQIFFGYGYGCSGYTITELYGRYAGQGTWAIESDFVNILVSRGILGFLGYYGFLIYIMIKGIKIDKRYFLFLLIIIIQGFGYNIQFDYLLLVESLLYMCVKNKINFFDRNIYSNSKNMGVNNG